MSRVSPYQIAQWVRDAGWAGTDSVTAVAVAIVTGQDPDTPGGLWGLGTAGDGATQTDAAFALWRGSGGDWDVLPGHRGGSWRLYLPVAASAVAGAEVVSQADGPLPTAVKAVTEAGESTGDALQTFGQIGGFLTTDRAWERIVKIGLGGGIILVSMLYLAKRSTFDQGVRFLRGVADNAGLILAARAGGAHAPGGGRGGAGGRGGKGGAGGKGGPSSSSSSPSYRGSHRRKPSVSPGWRSMGGSPPDDHPTAERPVVRYVGKAKPYPSKLPGDPTVRKGMR